jgi:4-carboxymuconolactone decarboxylase
MTRLMSQRSVEETFRRLTIGDATLMAAMANLEGGELDPVRLDRHTETLVRLGALVALDAPPSSFQGAVDEAQLAGARLEDLLAVLIAVAGPVGTARVAAAAPRIALAAGYDVEAALEELEPSDGAPVAGSRGASGVPDGRPQRSPAG